MASIRERVSRAGESTWAVLYRDNGRQTSLTFPDEKGAETFRALIDLIGLERALATMRGEDSETPAISVAELAERFLEHKAQDVTPRTLTTYRRDVVKWIEPWFGRRPAEAVDEADVQRWVDGMRKQLSPVSVAGKHMLLHSIYAFGVARSRRLVTHNPCQETELPKRVKKPPKGTTVPEFRAILAAAARRYPEAADLITFLGETGWRFSEGIALSVRDVEDDGRDVWVTVGQVFRLDGAGRQVLAVDSAKTYAAFRRIRLFPASAAVVRRRVVGRGPADLVFTRSADRPWNQSTFLSDTWPRIIADAQLGERRPTPHWLRHMHVAVLAAAGAPMQEIQRRIGHTSISTTIGVYGGMIGDVGDNVLGSAAALMAGTAYAPGVAPGFVGEVVLGELE